MFSVIDTGAGIKQDSLPYLFDAFRRVDEENNTGIEGTGLGLSIVKQLVELMVKHDMLKVRKQHVNLAEYLEKGIVK